MKQEINFKSKETKLSQKLCGEGPLYLLLKRTIEKVQKGNLFVINNSQLPTKSKRLLPSYHVEEKKHILIENYDLLY